MNTPAKLATFGAALGAVFAASLAAGNAVGSVPDEGEGHREPGGHGGLHAGDAEPPQGLAVSAGGYTIDAATTILPAGATTEFSFRILGPEAEPLVDYTVEAERELHFIVVGRDLTGYQHLHPTRAADGTWSLPLQLESPGTYKAFADFQPAGSVKPMTLAIDLFAPGSFQPVTLPTPSRTAKVDGYTVTLTGALLPGRESRLTFNFAKEGTAVADLQPYLGAYAHLVALRAGDLAYLHVHPHGVPGDGITASGPEVGFVAQVPTAGAYRLFVDFQHGGVVRTAEFTAVAGANGP